MFGLGKKTRAAEAIRRGVRASLTGAYFHHSEIEKFGLNESASAWLYTEAIAHHVYALGYISSAALKKEKWANLEFFFESAIDGMKEAEQHGGPSAEQLAPSVLNRYGEFEFFSGQDRIEGAHYRSSAELIARQDSTADLELITNALRKSTERYVADARKMFDI
jgi:hypothetical protein